MSIDHEKLAIERFTGTNMQNFNMITAVSQGAINVQLKALYKLSPENHPLKRFKQSFAGEPWILIDAVLDSPSIELLMNTQSRTVLYTMNIASGIYQYYDTPGPNAKRCTAKVDKWTLVFKVNLDFKVLEEDQKVPDHVKETLKQLEDYSIHQLFVDLNTADIMNFSENESKIGLPTPLLKITFAAYVQDYITSLKNSDKHDHSIIHYLPKFKKPENYPIPTLPPTDLNFQNLRFVPGAEKDNNMLIYLQMTGTKPVPSELLVPSVSNIISNLSGVVLDNGQLAQANWVVPAPLGEAGYDGTVALSREIFFDQWLLPKLNVINRVTTIYTDSVKAWFGSDMLDHFEVVFKTRKSWPEDKGQWEYDQPFSDDLFQYYDYTYRKESDEKEDTINPAVYGSAYCTASNRMKIPVGFGKGSKKSTIAMWGKSQMNVYWHRAPFSEVREEAWIQWTVNITFDGVDHGKLKIHVEHKFDKVGKISEEFSKDIDKDIQAIEKKLDSGEIKAGLEAAFTDSSWPFIFAGSTDFFIDEAGFNKNRDLLAKLKYVTHT